MVSYQLFPCVTKDEIVKACSIGLRNRLFVNQWCLREDFIHYKKHPESGIGNLKIVVAYHADDPIGIIFCDRGTISAFVRKSFRRRGIARNGIEFGDFKITNYGEGIRGSYTFWSKVVKDIC